MKNRRKLIVSAIAILCLAALAVGAALILRPRDKKSAEEDELVIYSPHPQEMTEYIVREFRQRTGIKVKVVFGGTGDLIDKLKKQDSAAAEADLFWGGGVDSLETIKNLFQAYRSPEQSAIFDIYRSAHGLWTPFSVLPVVIVYNTKLVSGDLIPDSWTDLLDPYFRDHVILADPAISGSAFTMLVTMLQTMSGGKKNMEAGWPFVKRFIAQLGSDGLVPGSSVAYNAVAEGEFFAGVTFENSAFSLKNAGKNVGYRYPSEGTSAVPDGIALLRQSRHPEEAKRFIDFALGRDVQSILMSKWFRRSVRNDVPIYEPALSKLNIIDYPIAESVKMRPEILSRWAEAYSQFRP
ncbi:MAG TPA: extracellular solute-binding protein [Rectinemataceae bacterium]|nr:extracellular solute-binding protein [Rectinemataceae bacterium]